MNRLMPAMVGLAWLAAGCASTAGPESSSPAVIQEAGTVVDVVTADELLVAADASVEDGRVTCREILRQASNQIERRCMTQAAWRNYDRAAEIRAQSLLRQMQGSPYR